MKITLTSVLVDDQAKALRFYTDVLGFVKKHDVPLGEHRWLTVVSPEDARRRRAAARARRAPGGQAVQGGARSRTASRSRRSRVDDVQAEYERLGRRRRASPRSRPTMGPVTTAVFDDTCGNLIQIASMG